MDAECLQYALTEAERLHFAEQGYLIVKGALTKEEVAKLEEASERIWHEHMANGLEPDQNLFPPNFIGQDQVFINLVDHPQTFPKVWALLNSWNIYLYHSHLGTTPQEGPVGTEMKNPLGFHQDSGRVNIELEFSPRPLLSLKVGFWLSDVSEEGRGNFYIVPGSHLDDKLHRPTDNNPAAAIPVRAKIGDAVFFDRRLWHARSPNYLPHVRKVLFLGV